MAKPVAAKEHSVVAIGAGLVEEVLEHLSLCDAVSHCKKDSSNSFAVPTPLK